MDDCGAQRNMSRYAELMLASGRNYSIENHKKPEGHNCGDGNAIDGGEKTTSCPSVDFCPFNWSQPLTARSPSHLIERLHGRCAVCPFNWSQPLLTLAAI